MGLSVVGVKSDYNTYPKTTKEKLTTNIEEIVKISNDFLTCISKPKPSPYAEETPIYNDLNDNTDMDDQNVDESNTDEIVPDDGGDIIESDQ